MEAEYEARAAEADAQAVRAASDNERRVCEEVARLWRDLTNNIYVEVITNARGFTAT